MRGRRRRLLGDDIVIRFNECILQILNLAKYHQLDMHIYIFPSGQTIRSKGKRGGVYIFLYCMYI